MAVQIPTAAASAGRSWKATEIGSTKNTGSNATVAPPDTTHSATTVSTSMPVEAQPAHAGTGPRSTTKTHTRAATLYVTRMVAYAIGNQCSTSHTETSNTINPISGKRRNADRRTGSAATKSMTRARGRAMLFEQSAPHGR